MVVGETQHVLLAVLVVVGGRRVSQPRGDGEAARQRVRQHALGHDRRAALAAQLERLAVST